MTEAQQRPEAMNTTANRERRALHAARREKRGFDAESAKLDAAETPSTDHLLGLIWFAYHEFNAIRARSGAPLDQYGMTTCTEEYWGELRDAFYAALPEEDRTPWPSDRARAIFTNREATP